MIVKLNKKQLFQHRHENDTSNCYQDLHRYFTRFMQTKAKEAQRARDLTRQGRRYGRLA